MLILLGDDTKADLVLLNNVDATAWSTLATVALDLVHNGANPKQYSAIAQQIGVAVETVRKCVEGLSYLFTESAKKVVSQLDFLDSVLLLGFPDELNQLLLKLYQENTKDMRAIMSKLSIGPASYHNLEWRLDVQLASRTLRRQVNPVFLLKLDVQDGSAIKSHILQTDPANLIHLTEQLEAALSEMKTAYVRRIVRNIK